MTIIDQEALEHRARALYTIPTTIAEATFDDLSASCRALYDPQAGQYVLNTSVSGLSAEQRYALLQCLTSYNGLRMILVDVAGDHALLKLYFFNRNSFDAMVVAAADARRLFAITGGRRIPAGLAAGEVQVVSVQEDPDADPSQPEPVLMLTVRPVGDYSTYTLSIQTEDFPEIQIDPLLSEIRFKFRPGCFRTDCAPEWTPAPPPADNPRIDYLAKDFDSFKHTLIAAMMQRVPGWQPTSEADLDQVLLELLAAAADELSDYQDRVMNEAYRGTARKRVSLARHARLMDYHIHQGNQASTWLALQVREGSAIGLPAGFPVWTGDDAAAPSTAIFMASRQPFMRLTPSFQDGLDSGTVSEDLRDEFDARGIALSHDARASVREETHQWLIVDAAAEASYFVRRFFDQLHVFRPCLFPMLNRLGLYTWDDAIPALAAGSTAADIQPMAADESPMDDEDSARAVQDLIREGTVRFLLVQEWLNPATGRTAGRDPSKRQLLRLLPGDRGAEARQDPVAGAWFVRVRWQDRDALRVRYCFTVDSAEGSWEHVSLFHGNLVPVCQGRPATTVFRDPSEDLCGENQRHYEPTERWGTICRLPDGPLLYQNTPAGGEVPPKSTLDAVVVAGGAADSWDEVISLVHSDDSDEGGDHFQVETDEYGRSLLRFGNGVNGKRLPRGAEVRCRYQVGSGPEGNIGADALRSFDSAVFPEVLACWNPFDVTNGREPEPHAEIIRRVPEAYRARQLRAVTLRDYTHRAEELEEVSRAAARYAWTGSWRTVQIAIDPAGTTALSPELREQIAAHLDAVRLIGEDLEIRPPRFVPLDIRITLCIHPDYWIEDVRHLLEQELSEGYTPDGRMAFFHPDRWTFGQGLHASELVGRMQRIEGVDHVVSVSIRRWNEETPDRGDFAEVRGNEILRVRNDPDHMEDGFITFDPQGGRQ